MTVALEQPRRPRSVLDRRTLAADFAERLRVMVEEATALHWPSPRYREDPVGFCRDILGIELWAKQAEVLESVRDHPSTSWKSGHRVGKSVVDACAALWFYSSFEDARVVCTSTTARQVDDIFWRAVQMLFTRAGRCLECRKKKRSAYDPGVCPHSARIDGKLGTKAKTGLVSDNFREIKGYTAKDVEAITGTAGKNLLFIVDEASGVAEAIFEGLEGNRAGWSSDGEGTVRILLTGNPTKTSGHFFDSHEDPKKKKYYHSLTTSSRETPNVLAGRTVIPGLATREWVEQMIEKYGEDSAFVKVRVDGVFPVGEDGKIFSLHLIQAAEERWHDEVSDPADPLYIGLDPAGESGTGDDTCMVARCGRKQLGMFVKNGLSEAAHTVHLLSFIEEHRASPRQKVIVVMDREGAVGARVFGHLTVVASQRSAPFELYGVRSSQKAMREPLTFDRIRDELCRALSMWMRAGGAILEDERLEKELHALEWEKQINGRLKCTPKKKLRKELGRSPDRYDALSLSVWEPAAERVDGDDEEEDDDFDDFDDVYGGQIDPYGGM